MRSQSALFRSRAGVRLAASKSRKRAELAADGFGVAVDLLDRQDRPLGPLPARVSHHAGAAADQDDRRVAEPLQPRRAHDGHQTAHVQRIGGGIEAYVGGKRASLEPLGQACGGVLQQAARRQSLEEVSHRRQWYPLESSLAIG